MKNTIEIMTNYDVEDIYIVINMNSNIVEFGPTDVCSARDKALDLSYKNKNIRYGVFNGDVIYESQ